jgi:hypothetical protein
MCKYSVLKIFKRNKLKYWCSLLEKIIISWGNEIIDSILAIFDMGEHSYELTD